MVFIKFSFERNLHHLHNNTINASFLRSHVASTLGSHDFKLYQNGKEIKKECYFENDDVVHVASSLPGGKGGFGSMLRAIGAQIEKTTNREACRDLSGRRLRDINEEQRLKKWLSKEAEREAEKERRRKDRIERLKAKPKHNFVDFEYDKEISELPERIDDALTAGMSKVSKRAIEEGESSSSVSQPKKKWFYDDISGSSDSDSEVKCDSSKTESHNSAVPSMSTDSRSEENSCSSDMTPTTTTVDPKCPPQDSMESMACTSDGPSLMDQTSQEESVAKEVPSTSSTTELLQLEDQSIMASKDTVVDELQAHSPVDLISFQDISELENFGMNTLKSELMSRGMKCGGSLSERAQRLWKVRGLQPHQYPANLLAKKKRK